LRLAGRASRPQISPQLSEPWRKEANATPVVGPDPVPIVLRINGSDRMLQVESWAATPVDGIVNMQFELEAKSRSVQIDDIHRDVRLDACRGVALWFVFIDHVPNNIVSWLTLRNYGFSDTTEVFVFVSGYTCMIAYGDVLKKQGWLAMSLHAVRRSWQIYVAFLLLLIAYLVLVQNLGSVRYLDETNTAVFFEHPDAAIIHAGLMQYKPVNTDILPLFMLLHLAFPALLWLLTRSTWVALATSVLLYISVQIWGIDLQAWPRGEWYFNPLAWQILFVFGMWCASADPARLQALVRSRGALVCAILYLVFSLTVTLSWQVKALGGLLPDTLSKLIYPIDKSNLDPLRLLHFFALALIVARLVPHTWRGLSSRWATVAIRCGENSLTIFCLSVLLSLAGHVILEKMFGTALMQIVISIAGISLMIATATLLTRAARLERGKARLF
jgi:hypothetical protein